MFSMSLWAIITATIAITSKTANQIIVARVLNCEIHCTSRYSGTPMLKLAYRYLHRNGAGSGSYIPIRNYTQEIPRICRRYISNQSLRTKNLRSIVRLSNGFLARRVGHELHCAGHQFTHNECCMAGSHGPFLCGAYSCRCIDLVCSRGKCLTLCR